MTDNDRPATVGSVHGEVLSFARKMLGSQALATLLLMGMAVGGYKVLAAEARDAGTAEVRPVQQELEALRARVTEKAAADDAVHREEDKVHRELDERLRRQERLAVETAINVRLLLENRGIRPVQLEPIVVDGGAP